MHDLETNADSVNFLMTELCRSIAHQNGVDDETSVAKLKMQSFEILLKRSKKRTNENVENFEPLRALDMQIFSAKLSVNGNSDACAKFSEFDKYLAIIEKEEYFTIGAGKEILQLLLELQGNFGVVEEPSHRLPTLLVPGPFTLHANYVNNQYYPLNANKSLATEAPKYFKGTQKLRYSSNPYLPKFHLDGDSNLLAQIEQKYATPTSAHSIASNATSSCTFTDMTKQLWGNSMRINPKAFRLFSDSKVLPQKQVDKKSEILSCDTKAPITSINETGVKQNFSWNWENLGNFGMTCPKPFVSDFNSATLDLESIFQQSKGQEFEAKIVTMHQLLQDIKSLTVGIQSDSFFYDEETSVFKMHPNITVENVLPATIHNFFEVFLNCGTHYKYIQNMIKKNNFKLRYDGFLYKALCSALDEYLFTFRQFVFSKQNELLMEFYKRMKKTMKQIVDLIYTLPVHSNAAENMPMQKAGSQFLGRLYREIMRLTDKDYIMLLVFILKRCCHVYFKHLQKWIFNGILDDPCHELFISFYDHYRVNTKHYYDKAFHVNKDAVPGFFQNYETKILQCGKYTMLLKACKPDHRLFELEHPAISVCLTFDEIQKLELKCDKYFERARELCGKPITIRQIFETCAEQKKNFYTIVSQRWRENMEKWSAEQHALAVVAAEHKKRRLDELATQLEDANQRKVAERRANVELELKYLREAEQMEEQRLLCENVNLRKRIDYYQELSDLLQCDSNEKQKSTFPVSEYNFVKPRLTKQPLTPVSTTSITDFESCDGEDEDGGSSEYAECISDDFVQKFEKSESDLQSLAIINENVNNNKKESTGDLKSHVLFEESANVVATALGCPLKRSASDFLNSNELPALVAQTVQQKNRQHAMSGANMQLCFKNAQKVELYSTAGKNLPLTEAQRNKLKVLSHEFYNIPIDTTHTKSLPDINLNTLPDCELTDLQRNRRRMMQNDLFSEYNKDPLANRALLNLELNTERARNRRKVLDSEYHILTGQTQSTGTFTAAAEAVATPMSTTSDTPITAEALLADFDAAAAAGVNFNDIQNGNPQAKSALKLNVAIATNPTKAVKISADTADGLMQINTAATQLELTPMSALNTTGIMAKYGFQFKCGEGVDDALAIPNECNLEDESFVQPDYSDPYKRCVELIESNFHCASRSPFVRLHKNDNSLNKGDTHDSSAQSSTLKEFNLNDMSVITLTEFLQKSVVIPLKTHLKIVNNEVMRMFLEDLQILQHFESLRNYFFLMDGEFGAIICDSIFGKLENGTTPRQLFNVGVLKSIMENACGSSMTGNDKNSEHISFDYDDVPEVFDPYSPSALQNLTLSYKIEWPLNIILNKETMDNYANIFKYLIKVRRISWILERAYQILKEAVKRNGTTMLKSPQYRHLQQIRHKFYHFVQALQNHITANALQASWKTFKDELINAKTIEDIYRKHANYIKKIRWLCMLNRSCVEFQKHIENIFIISLRFYNSLNARKFKKRSKDEHFTHSRYYQMRTDELEFDQQIKHIIYLGNKIVRKGYQFEIGELITLINYNNYYIK